MIIDYFSKIKNEFKIYDIIEENQKIYIVLENNNEIIKEIDDLLLSGEFSIEKESIIEGHGNPIKKEELFNLFKMEEAMCKIQFERIEKNKVKKGKGSGFFCEIKPKDFPVKYCLFTNNHVLNEENIKINDIIHFEYFNDSKYIEKIIEIGENRKVYTNKALDYTCIEILESDNIKHFFKIDPKLYESLDNIEYLKNNDIFILQYPNGNDLSFSNGKILSIKDNIILHNASTEGGSSGSPIIRRSKDNYIIGLHFGGYKKNKYNLATIFNEILKDISKGNEIYCIYSIENEKEINILHDYNEDLKYFNDEAMKELYYEAKKINKKLFEENIELFINNKKIKFDYKIKINDSSKEIKVKFKFKKKLTNTSFMFKGCSSLVSIDLSSFYIGNVTNVCYMFSGCSSLKSIDLSLFNSNNVTNMSYMFSYCSSLSSLDLSSFKTNNVTNMSCLFSFCSSLKSIDLSSFNTSNVDNMSFMFGGCSSLESIDLSSFKTNKVTNMSCMFSFCSSLNSINLSTFNTSKVSNMSCMFSFCFSLKSLDLSSFNTTDVTNMKSMFGSCSSLELIDLSSFNTNNVSNLCGMFCSCSSLKSLDLSLFNTNKVSDMSYMFRGCSSLKSIDLSSFNTTKVADMSCIFDGCISLKKKNIKINNKKDKILNEFN